MRDYVEVLEKFLPLREPNNKTSLYKLFIRTLTHEWEASDPKKIKGLAWIMKNTRNWIAHNSNLFNALDEQMLAYCSSSICALFSILMMLYNLMKKYCSTYSRMMT